MKKKFTTFSIFISVFLICSCNGSKVYFNSVVREKVEKNSIDLKSLQFYIDRTIELRREVSSSETAVSYGKLKEENGKKIHVIKLKKHTPGVCVGYTNDQVDISFEVGENKKLTFTTSSDPNEIKTYTIYADEWKREQYVLRKFNHKTVWRTGYFGKVMYNNQLFSIQPGGNGAGILVKKRRVNQSEIKKDKMQGRKVGKNTQ
jgi:hypothetical protein